MNELRPHGRELLKAARLERTPSPAERERLLEQLLASTLSARASVSPARARRTSTKIVLLAAVAAAIGFVLYWLGSPAR